MQVYLVLEMAGHGDLLDYIKLRGALPEDRAKLFFLQLGEAVEYLHHNHIVHRSGREYSVLSGGCINSTQIAELRIARKKPNPPKLISSSIPTCTRNIHTRFHCRNGKRCASKSIEN